MTKTTNILIVDDVPDNLLLLEEMFKELPYNFIKAHSGKEAIEKTLLLEFSLIILDIQMPDMDGYKTAERIRQNSNTEGIPIIFITAYEENKVQMFKGHQLGAVDYLLKPFNVELLASKINCFVRLYQQKEELEREIHKRKTTEELLKHNAYHDTLTELYNRNYFEEEIRRVNIERNYPISIILVDIDKLKYVNDTFGHAKGDELLKIAGITLKTPLRKDDMVARIGGDEFAIVLKNIPHERAYEISETLRKDFKKATQHIGSATFSIGLYTITDYKSNFNMAMKLADEDLYNNKTLANATTQHELVNSLSKIMELKDIHTQKHGHRMVDIAIQFGQHLGMINGKIRDLQLLASFHDIGKVGIPDSILQKPDKLDKEEWGKMKTHSELGCKILETARQFKNVSKYVLHHHESWDGKGYPHSLKGKDIPLHSRIIAIIDTYDTIISGRPYKEARTHSEALHEIQRCAGTQFDPDLVKKFVYMMEKQEEKLNKQIKIAKKEAKTK